MLFSGWWIDLSVPRRTFEREPLDRFGSSCSFCSPLLCFRRKHGRMFAGFRMLACLCHNLCGGGGTARKSYLLENKITNFISGISMEIYLSHMVIFRAVEKLGLNRSIGTGWTQYMFTALAVLCGTIVFAAVMQKLIGLAERKFEKNCGD